VTDDTVLFWGRARVRRPTTRWRRRLLARGHRGRIINATSVRHRRCRVPRRARRLDGRFPQYRYFALTTREPENVDPIHPNYVGKLYLQGLFTSGRLAEMADDPLDPARTHVFLCGNPDMIGLVPSGRPSVARPGCCRCWFEPGFGMSPGAMWPDACVMKNIGEPRVIFRLR
jgi:ferredoxin/flavodoxin---NADP+ reductase